MHASFVQDWKVSIALGIHDTSAVERGEYFNNVVARDILVNASLRRR